MKIQEISKKKSSRFPKLLWPELYEGILLKRYKRFLADVRLKDGGEVTAHCPNSGAMLECCLPGQRVWLSYHENPKRKLKYTWELIEMPGSLVGVNTQIPNRLVAESLLAASVPEFFGYESLQREVKVGEKSRLDILLKDKDGGSCFVEIKNCTLVKDRLAAFPDAVSTRGQKHLRELAGLKAEGHRCVMFYLIQRGDAESFSPAAEIDPVYAETLREVYKKGVEIVVYDVHIDLEGISLNQGLPFLL